MEMIKGYDYEQVTGKRFEECMQVLGVSKFERDVHDESKRWPDDPETLARWWYAENERCRVAVGIELIRDTHVRFFVDRDFYDRHTYYFA